MPKVKLRTYIALIIMLTVSATKQSVGQDVEGSMVFSTNLLANPAFTGAEGTGSLKLVYRDYYPGLNLNLGTIYMGYDTFNEALHGGVGFYIQENKFGDILNDFHAGANYSYHLQASRELFINAGFNASVLYRSINRNNIILPDQIDPLLGPVLSSGENLDIGSRLLFDLGVGFLFSYRNINAGFSVMHLGKPDLTGKGSDDGKLMRRFTVHGNAEFKTGFKDLNFSPLLFMNLQSDLIYGGAGVELSYKPLSIIAITHYDLSGGVNSLQTGFSYQTGRFQFSYNYFFSPFFKSNGIQATQSNLISIKVGLNNVDKRGVMKAINCPKL